MKHPRPVHFLLCLCFALTCVFLPVQGENESRPANQESVGKPVSQETTKPDPHYDSEGRPILGEGETGILIEASTGTVLYDADSQKRMFPASCTKLMTALLAAEALESGAATPSEEVEITAAMLAGLDPDSSNMELVEGERIAFSHLLEGLLIPSGNDAAMAIAFRLGGNPESFVDSMNQKAGQLGLSDTHFVNPHGLHDENHYTTAADLAAIAREAMKHQAIRDVVDIAHIKMPPTNKTAKERYYINTNGLLSNLRYSGYAYQGATGIKTGRTSQAGNCLVSSASRDGMELIGVVLHGKEIADSHQDSIRLLDYGFANYQILTAAAQGEILGEAPVRQGKSADTVILSAKETVRAVAPKDTKKEALEIQLETPEALYAPLTRGQDAGTLHVLLNGRELAVGPLQVEADVARSPFWPVMAAGEWLWSKTPVRWAVYLLLAAALALLVLGLNSLRQARKNTRKPPRRRGSPRN